MRIHPVLWFLSLAAVGLLAGCYDLTLAPYMGEGGGQDTETKAGTRDGAADLGADAPYAPDTADVGDVRRTNGEVGAADLSGAGGSGGTGGATAVGTGGAGGIDAPVATGAGGTAGASGVGGTTGTGGTTGSGGTASSGGTTASGGRIGTGGAVGFGGAVGTGGAFSTAGSVGTGGMVGTGGVVIGGMIGTGGSASGTGGVTAAGGTTGTGGIVAVFDPAWAQWAMPNGQVDVTAGAPNLASYTDNGNGTVTDNITGLMWQQAVPAGTYTWEQAKAYCPTLTLAGHADWRLPKRIELVSIVDFGRSSPAIDTTYFPSTPLSGFWSSSLLLAGSSSLAWYVYFFNGSTSYYEVSSTVSNVRCVR